MLVLFGLAHAAPVSFEVSAPPVVDVPASIQVVGVGVRAVDGDPLDVTGLAPQDPPSHDERTRAATETVAQLLLGERFHAASRGRVDGPSGGVMPPERVMAWCVTNQDQGLISLEDFEVGFTTDTQPTGAGGGQSIEASWTLTGRATWRMYACDDGRVIDELKVTGETLDSRRTATGPSPAKALERLPPVADALRGMAVAVGQAYGRRLSPTRTTVTREILTGKDLADAEAPLAAGDWEAAVDVWMAARSIGRPASRARAAHNLAVAAERFGDLEQALAWCDTSLAEDDSSLTRGYRLTLQRRQKESVATVVPPIAEPVDELPLAVPQPD